MADFKKSFNIGMDAAKRAQANRDEIAGVFADVNEQLSEPTNGRILIETSTFYEPQHPLKMAIFEKRPTYMAISARNPIASSTSKELARWSQDRAGYPCKIQFGSKEIYCEDKASLEKGISTLLSDPIVGAVLHNLMSMPAKNVDDDAQDERSPNN